MDTVVENTHMHTRKKVFSEFGLTLRVGARSLFSPRLCPPRGEPWFLDGQWVGRPPSAWLSSLHHAPRGSRGRRPPSGPAEAARVSCGVSCTRLASPRPERSLVPPGLRGSVAVEAMLSEAVEFSRCPSRPKVGVAGQEVFGSRFSPSVSEILIPFPASVK